MDTPGTLLTALAILLAPLLLMPCDESPSIKEIEFFCKAKTADSVFLLLVVVITTSSKESVFSVTSTITSELGTIFTSDISIDL